MHAAVAPVTSAITARGLKPQAYQRRNQNADQPQECKERVVEAPQQRHRIPDRISKHHLCRRRTRDTDKAVERHRHR